MKPKLNTQLDKYSMFLMLREHPITFSLWADTVLTTEHKVWCVANTGTNRLLTIPNKTEPLNYRKGALHRKWWKCSPWSTFVPLSQWGDTICVWVVRLFILRPQLPALLEEDVCMHGKALAPFTRDHWVPSPTQQPLGGVWRHLVLQNTSSFISENNVFRSLLRFLRNKQCTTEAKHRTTITHRAGFCYKTLSSGLQHKQISTL